MCCAENEELSVWEPFHMLKGFKPTESTVSLFRGWSLQGFSVGSAQRMAEVMNGLGLGGATFILDPLVAKTLKAEGFKTKQELAEFLASEVKPRGPGGPGRPGGRRPMASSINIIVVGGEWNPIWLTTDFAYTQTVGIDKWIPKGGVRHDAIPWRMPAQQSCSESVCGLPGNILPGAVA